MYFKSLINGMVDIPPIRPEVRESVLQLFQENGQEYIFDILKNVDAQYSERIHKNDKQRTIRALEVYYGTGKKYSDYLSLSNNKNSINYVIIVLNIERKILYVVLGISSSWERNLVQCSGVIPCLASSS